MLDSLANAGYVTRVVNPTSRRENIIKITPKGLDFIEEVWPGYDKLIFDIFKHLPEGDIITVRGFGFAGIDGVVVKNAQEAKEAIRQMLTDEDVGLILVAQGIANLLGGEFDAYRFRKHLPLILSVEDSTGEQAF